MSDIYYKNAPIAVNDDEFKDYVSLKTLHVLKTMDDKLNTMKGIMIFWMILTIVNIAASIYFVTKIVSVFR